MPDLIPNSVKLDDDTVRTNTPEDESTADLTSQKTSLESGLINLQEKLDTVNAKLDLLE